MADLTLQQIKALRFWQTQEITSLHRMASHAPLNSYRAFTDAATGETATAPSGATAVRLNNRLRRTVEAALGGLTLLSPDPARRIQAAQSVFKTHDAAFLPVIEGALQKETNSGAKRAFAEAKAAIVLFDPKVSEADKLDAISVISEIPLSRRVRAACWPRGGRRVAALGQRRGRPLKRV